MATTALLSLWALAGCSADSAPVVAEPVRPAYVVPARPGPSGGLSFIGEVRAAQRAELGFAVSGRVASVAVDVGDSVRAGQVLARLDSQPLGAQVTAAQGEVARAKAQVDELRTRRERLQRADAEGAASAGEVSAVGAELAAAEATLRSATAQRDAAAWSLEQATLRAPVSGVVASRALEAGQAIGPGAPVITIDGEGRELSMLLPAEAPLRPGDAVTLRQGQASIPSRVLRVSQRVETGGQRRVHLTAPAGAAVGSTWSVALAGAADEARLQVPLRAVTPEARPGMGHVLRIAKDGRTVERVAVRLGAVSGQSIEVLSGLNDGDPVVIAGAAGIRAGSVVKPVAQGAERS